ncbi:MAG: nucleoside deaminase [Nitriliruptorales bacterium]|nr:nucleoside deaminase [Nitriliruptorales bacterium]
MSDDRHWLRRAITLAAEGSGRGDGGPFGAVIVRGHVAIGEGWNRVLARPDPTAHAEVEAIRAAAEAIGSHRLDGAVAYASSEPCPMCWTALRWARIERLVYAAGREAATRIGFDDARFWSDDAEGGADTLEVTQMLEDEASVVMDAWGRTPGRQLY